MSSSDLPPMPEHAPAMGNRLTRFLGRALLRLLGWRIEGELPNLPKLVLCGAPHTSNWDFVLAMASVLALGLRFSFLMKKEAFFWPLKSTFMSLGGIPVDRNASQDIVAQAKLWFNEHDQVWLAITPEGTRSKVDKWKTGFLRIAHAAEVPVLLVAWHYPKKTLYLDKVWQPTGEHSEDADAIRSYLSGKYTGAHPEKQ